MDETTSIHLYISDSGRTLYSAESILLISDTPLECKNEITMALCSIDTNVEYNSSTIVNTKDVQKKFNSSE